MTPEQLLGLPDKIENLSDEELVKHLAKFFPSTRPRKPVKYVTQKLDGVVQSLGTTSPADKLRAALAAAFKAQGCDAHGNPLPKASKSSITTVYKS